MFRLAFIALLFVSTSCTLLVGNEIDGNGPARVTSCVGQDDGTLCVGADHCLGEECRRNTCGDRIVSRVNGEQCDDGNAVPGDGCQPSTCQYTCSEAAPCPDDTNSCNGAPVCDATTHTCSPGTAATDGTACTQEGGGSGTCVSGLCVSASCGDGIVTAGEDCEPSVDGAGCRSDCMWVCTADFQCPSADPCNAPGLCDTASHTCYPGPPMNCDDGYDCTADSCNVSTGRCDNTFIDADGDTYGPDLGGSCAVGYMLGDCDDTNPFVRPGLPDQCDNGIDDDCNEIVDDSAGSIVCAVDRDGDGFGDPTTTTTACSCPMGYVAFDGRADCNDNTRLASPGVPEGTYSAQPICADGTTGDQFDQNLQRYVCKDGSRGSFDLDCDGLEEIQRGDLAYDACAATCDGGGWDGYVPSCGEVASYVDCYYFTSCLYAFPISQSQSCR